MSFQGPNVDHITTLVPLVDFANNYMPHAMDLKDTKKWYYRVETDGEASLSLIVNVPFSQGDPFELTYQPSLTSYRLLGSYGYLPSLIDYPSNPNDRLPLNIRNVFPTFTREQLRYCLAMGCMGEGGQELAKLTSSTPWITHVPFMISH